METFNCHKCADKCEDITHVILNCGHYGEAPESAAHSGQTDFAGSVVKVQAEANWSSMELVFVWVCPKCRVDVLCEEGDTPNFCTDCGVEFVQESDEQ